MRSEVLGSVDNALGPDHGIGWVSELPLASSDSRSGMLSGAEPALTRLRLWSPTTNIAALARLTGLSRLSVTKELLEISDAK